MRRKRKSVVAVALALSLFSTTLNAGTTEAAGDTKTSTVKMYNTHIGEASKSGYSSAWTDVPEKYTKAVASSEYQEENSTKVPSKYDSRDYNVLTEIKNQGNFGICWAFATIGAAESNALKKGLVSDPSDIDLSEYHLVWNAFNQTTDPLGLKAEDNSRITDAYKSANTIYASLGGNYLLAIPALAAWRGLADEEVAPLTELEEKFENKMAAAPDDSVAYKDSYHLQNAEVVTMTDDNINRIKQYIMDKGGASTAVHVPESNEEAALYTETGNYRNYKSLYYTDNSVAVNHGVMIVGWDDDYAVDNFNENNKPKNPGAWLIRNSWGDYNDEHGYFWMSYEDVFFDPDGADLQKGKVVFYEVEKADNYEKNYQYDSGLPTGSVNEISAVSNVFTMQEDEKLQAVSFFSLWNDLNYEISIYELTDKTNPASGKQVGQTLKGYFPDSGYYTIDLTESGVSDIPMKKGTSFSVILKLTNSQGEVLPYECEVDYSPTLSFGEWTGSVGAETGESFLLFGNDWHDVTIFDPDGTGTLSENWTIKAFTSAASAEEIAAATATETPATEPTSTVAPTPIATETPATASKEETTSSPSVSSSKDKKNSAIVKKLKFTPNTKKLKVGKSLKLKKYLKITKKTSGKVKISYSFAKKKYKAYATLTSSGVLKAKKKGKGKTITVYATAKDGSGKKAKMKIKLV